MHPIHDTPILGMVSRPPVATAIEYGNAASFWVEYPSGLVDLSRTNHLDTSNKDAQPPALTQDQLEIAVEGGRTIRINKSASAVVIIDMQK